MKKRVLFAESTCVCIYIYFFTHDTCGCGYVKHVVLTMKCGFMETIQRLLSMKCLPRSRGVCWQTMLLTNRGTPQNSSALRQIKTRTNLYSVYLYEILCVITIVIFNHVLSLFLFNVLLIDDVPVAIINPCLIAFRLNQERMMKPSMPGFQWVLLCFNADFQ